MTEPLLSIRNLKVHFYTYAGIVKALDGVDLDVYREETSGLVGETGCGKSVTSLSILRLVPNPGKIVEGKILFQGENLLEKSEEEMREIRGRKIAMIFQDPMTYLNPVLTIGDQVAEAITLHQDLSEEVIRMRIDELQKKHEQIYSSPNAEKIRAKIEKLYLTKKASPKLSWWDVKKASMKRALQVLNLVRMPYPERILNLYPHELSGGMRQRALIAMSISCNPSLLIADEATTFLDVTIQAQILHLLNELRQETKTSMLIVTHDLGIVAEMCDRVLTMYAGVIIECAKTRSLFKNPAHPYTRGLLGAIPKLHQKVEKLEMIPGTVPDLIHPPAGCKFHPRCLLAKDICKVERPGMIEVESNHFVACHLYGA